MMGVNDIHLCTVKCRAHLKAFVNWYLTWGKRSRVRQEQVKNEGQKRSGQGKISTID